MTEQASLIRIRNQTRLIIALLLVAILIAWTNTPLLAQQTQEAPEDLADLTLDELMELDVLYINVLGTHTHLAGEWMNGYKFMFMKMQGNLDGTNRRTAGDVLQDFPVTPTDMNMAMHMIEVMYSPWNDLTLMAMFPYLDISMDHLTRSGVQFTTETQGIGDISLSGLYTVYGEVEKGGHRLLVIPGLSFPTGSIDERGDTPAGNQQLPYPMQLGSGTFDLLAGFAYLGESESWAWLTEAKGTIRLGKNSRDYSLGNQLHLNAWVSRLLTSMTSLSAQIDGFIWGNIDGADPELNPAVVPTADPNRRGGKRVDFVLGLNLYASEGRFNGNRLAIEAGLPVYQSLDGPQLENDWRLAAVWNWTF